MTRKIVQLIGVLCLFLAGCSFSYATPNELFQPPQLNGEDENIQHNIINKLPESAVLMAPNKASPKQNVFKEDLNNDGKEEIVLLFKEASYANSLVVHVYEYQEKWELTSKVELAGYEVDSFKMVPGETGATGFVGVTNANEQNKQLHVVHLDADSLKKVESYPYLELVWQDMNDDKKEDLTLIELERNERAEATLYEINEGRLSVHSSVKLDPYVNQYFNIEGGRVSEHEKGIWVDQQVGAHSGSSALLVVDDGRLMNVFQNRISETYKPYPVESRDVNGDNILEMGIEMSPPEQFTSMADTPWIQEFYQWQGLEDGRLQLVQRRYSSFEDGFYIDFPSSWPKDLNIEKESNEVTIVEYPSSEPLYRIRWKDREDWKPERGYTRIGQTEKHIYEVDETYSTETDLFHLWAEELD